MNAESYMYRCLNLAALGLGKVAPNPMVGALLVYENKIIGEGYHENYGASHAEVNAIQDAKSKGNGELISQSKLFVSLEPCSHYGKTPPCTELIIQHRIPVVHVGCKDPFIEVNGRGIEALRKAGIEVYEGVLEKQCQQLNKRFFTFHKHHRPYIILKWAETGDGFMAQGPFDLSEAGKKRLFISNEYTNRLVHKWRSEEASILIGTNTALLDDPLLTIRSWTGNNPVRLVVDMELKLPSSLKVFNKESKTIVFNTLKHEENPNLVYYQVTTDVSLVHQVLNALYQYKIQSVIVEGGARLLQSFIDEELWDEARVISNREFIIGAGLQAPQLINNQKIAEHRILNDQVIISRNNGA